MYIIVFILLLLISAVLFLMESPFCGFVIFLVAMITCPYFFNAEVDGMI